MRRLILAAALLALTIAPLRAEEPGDGWLLGGWVIEIVDGPSRGDHGVIDISRGPDGLVGAMRFTDSRSNVTADETCRIRADGTRVTVRCATDQPGWLPDDFDLVRIDPATMKGPHISAVSGEALFRRPIADEPVS